MRAIISFFTGAATALAAAGTLAAQQPAPRRDEAPPPRREEPRGTVCYNTDSEKPNCQSFSRMSFDSVMAKRAALGLQLSPTGSMRDTIGVFVARVTPKGPAENAGIVEGDRIVSINGVDLRVNSADAGDSYASDLPTRRLTREVGKITPGKVVTLRVWSGGRIRDVNVTAGRASDMRGQGFDMMFGGPEGMMLRAMPGMNGSFPRVNIESFPRIRMEDMPRAPMEGLQRMRLEEMPRLRENMDMMRERMRDLPMQIRELEMAPMRMRLRENGGRENLTPSRVRVIYRDSAGKWTSSKTKEARAKADKAAREKAEKEKEKN
jgi:hypothetical protein